MDSRPLDLIGRTLIPPSQGIPTCFQAAYPIVCCGCFNPLNPDHNICCGHSPPVCTSCTITNFEGYPLAHANGEFSSFCLWAVELIRLRALNETHMNLVANIEQQLFIAQARKFEQQNCLTTPRSLAELAALTRFIDWKASIFQIALVQLGQSQSSLRLLESYVRFNGVHIEQEMAKMGISWSS